MAHIAKLSNRGLANLESSPVNGLEDDVHRLPSYDPEACPDGLIDLSGAVNTLMGDVVAKQMDDFAQNYSLHNATSYGPVTGPKGSENDELSRVVAGFVNRHFEPAHPVQTEEVIVTNGVSALIDLVAFNLCDVGEGVLVLVPTYSMFKTDLCARAGLEVVKVSTVDIPDQFSAQCSSQVVSKLEEAVGACRKQGIKAKAMLLCNPCNPCGRSYSKETLLALARFCGRHRLHLLSDEIYAMSSFDSPDSALDTFSSVLSIPDDPAYSVFGENIHCMYGASKDFAAGGLRLGFLITRSQLLWKTCRRLCLFTWVATFPTAFFTHFLSNDKAVEDYLALYRKRLRESYVGASAALRHYKIPFEPANSGMFFLIKLTQWLRYFDGPKGESRETELSRYLAFAARVFMSMGEVRSFQRTTVKHQDKKTAKNAKLSFSPVPGCFRFVHAAGDSHMIGLAILRLSQALGKLEAGPVFGETEAPPTPSTLSNASCSVLDEKSLQAQGLEIKPSGFRSVWQLLSCTRDE
ncbi:hypothetical protein LTR85_012170 [Meristemomyces frigidus]|nr:hypothetical protein LTR85_012170 [Meristemomyces frigidus]